MQTFVSIKASFDDEDVTCGVTNGDILLVRHPMKMYLSFNSNDSGAKFYINSFYSKTLTDDKFVNKEACSDKGAHLGDVNDGRNDRNDRNSSSGKVSKGGTVLSGNIKIEVQSVS